MLSFPKNPETVTENPKSLKKEATFTPLPPGSACSHSTRLTSPALKLGIEAVWSMAGLSVIVAILGFMVGGSHYIRKGDRIAFGGGDSIRTYGAAQCQTML